MRQKNVKIYRAVRYYQIRAYLRLGILILACLLALFGLMSYWAQYTGTFVISLDKESRSGLSVCETSDFLNPTSMLHAQAKKNIHPIEYTSVPIQQITATDGNSDVRNCFGFTYYLKNVGETVVDVGVNIMQEGATVNLDKCSRILVCQDDQIIGVFKTTDNYIDANDKTPPDLYKQYYGINVYAYNIYKLYPGDVVKFTVIIWVEGWDIDCTDDKIGGSVQYNMTIGIIKYYNENEI